MKQASRRATNWSLDRRHFLKGGLGVGAMALGGPLLLAAGAPDEPSFAGNTTLNYGAWQTPDTLDPATTALAATSRVLCQVFDPLLNQVQGSTKLLPGLATSWSVSSDAKTYTFKLLSGVQFHDGTPLDADAVKFTFDRIVDPATKALSALGAMGPYDHSVVVDPQTIQVVFSEPYAAFPNLITQIILAPVSPTAVRQYGSEFGNHPVGTGPFKVTDYVQNDHVTMTRNSAYRWAPAFYGKSGPANLQTINWKIIPDDTTRQDTLQTGESDVIEYLVPQSVAQFSGNSKYSVVSLAAPGSPRVIMLNTAKAPTDELAVRQAMNYAVDQQEIVNTLFKGVYKPAHTQLEELTLGYDATLAKMYVANRTKAGQLLESAGWKMGSNGIRQKNGQPLNPLFINIANDQFDGVAQIVQNEFRQVGINLTLRDESEPTVFSTYDEGTQNLSEIFYWYNDPSLLYSLYHSSQIKNGFNWAKYSNPSVDSQLVEAAGESDTAQRVNLYQQAQETMMKDAVVIPIQGKRTVMAMKSQLKGIKYTSITYPLLYTAHWK
jgi:peptide/nickel transport system substrate-binding protein